MSDAANQPPLPADYLASLDLGRRLADLCRQGKHLDAVNTLYADDIVSVEVCGDENMPAEMRGIEAIRGKNQWWTQNHEVHGGSVDGPYPHGDRVALVFKFDVTPKIGPNAGQRVHMEEIGLYTVANGKIVKEEFFYDMTTMTP